MGGLGVVVVCELKLEVGVGEGVRVGVVAGDGVRGIARVGRAPAEAPLVPRDTVRSAELGVLGVLVFGIPVCAVATGARRVSGVDGLCGVLTRGDSTASKCLQRI